MTRKCLYGWSHASIIRSLGRGDAELLEFIENWNRKCRKPCLHLWTFNAETWVHWCGDILRRFTSLCDCSAPLPALEPDRVKPFQFASTGYGKKHALTKGLYALRKEGHKARWLIEVACFKCKATDQSIYPAPLNRVGRVTNTSGHRNVLLCQPCIDEIGGAFYYWSKGSIASTWLNFVTWL